NFPGIFIVAFKAEYNVSEDKLIESARLKLERENLNLVIANDIKKSGFGSDTTEVYLINKKNINYIPTDSKDNIAREIWEIIDREMKGG
ncbi:MAG TPA: hypothetical protein ENG12_00315, partial [Candidatus Altiarchaeales archaeon]|nr:hypothetical protein [Candidatus Altiarchaeales archaeon]